MAPFARRQAARQAATVLIIILVLLYFSHIGHTQASVTRAQYLQEETLVPGQQYIKSKVSGVNNPVLLYGTAWKQDRTRALTKEALRMGFPGFDTAGQPRHYDEQGAGQALSDFFEDHKRTREHVFVQTKFTLPNGQDPANMPYHADDPIPVQVNTSFAHSLINLGVQFVDSYLLHGPSQGTGLGEVDKQVWRAMEALYESGQARQIGVSNFNAGQLRKLWDFAVVKPAVIQNRCYANTQWDKEIRGICSRTGIIYQGFSVLTANPKVVQSDVVAQIAKRHRSTPEQVVLRFGTQVGMTVLSGPTHTTHMRQDMWMFDFTLAPEEVSKIETAGM